ncbi:ABC transporter substrate-binding protein [Acidovorax sp. LjRoot129]|uniref:ABC transporter substrate-binding protein n=1 Tax=Acidovorax sp. LjRoot129 TaxID=3342260 RepID=UPI003ECDC98F
MTRCDEQPGVMGRTVFRRIQGHRHESLVAGRGAAARPVVCRGARGAQDEIVLGQSASFTGSFASQAAAYRDGALLYLNEVNRRGGIHGRKIRLVSLDDQYKPELAVENTIKLIEQHGAFALTHYTWTPVARAVIPVATKYKVPFFAPYTGASDVYRASSPMVFTVRASFHAELEAIIRHVTTLGIRRIAFVRYTSKTGDELLAELEPLLKKYGATLVGTGSMANNSAQPKDAIRQLAPVEAQAVLLGVSGTDAVSFIQGYEAATGRKAQYYARSLVGARQLAQELGDQAFGISVTQLVPNPFKQVVEVSKEYNRLLKGRAAGAQPDYISLEGFIAAKVFCEALKRTGPAPTRVGFLQTLSQMKVDVGGFEVSFSPGNHNGSDFVDMTMIGRNGRPIN